MRVAIVSPPFLPNFCRSQRWPVVNRTRAMRYPDWLAYAAGVIEKDGFDLAFRDFIAEEAILKDVADWVGEWKPDLLVMDATTPSIYNDIKCAQMCKSANAGTHISFVGPHVTVLPKETMMEAGGAVDSIAMGEYDYTIRDLARTLDGGGHLDQVEGLAWGGATDFVRNKARVPIENLDELPLPPWHFLDVSRYRNNTYLFPYLDQISGRGCPNLCQFCQWPQVMHGRRYRYCSPERVVAEMLESFQRYKVKEIFFEDDTLTANRKRLREVCELILQQNIRMKWSCNSRVDWADLELMKLMKEAGCRMVLIGPESGSQTILDNVRKGIRVEQTTAFVTTAKKAGLATHSCWVMGLPGETRETMAQTVHFVKSLDTDTIQASSVMPQVGTELYNWAMEQGYLTARSWADYAMQGEQTAVMEYPNLSQQEMNAAVNNLLRSFYFQPHVMFRLLRQSISHPSLLSSYWTGFIMLIKYLFSRAKVVEKLSN
ncbi:MAG: radical SAM protein [Spartobacteria bacterium]|nr:radical SAM protein [Spartobacteria bacterium]